MSTDVEHSVIDQFRQLYDQGLYLQAYELVKPYGPLQEWTDPDMQVLGGRLATNLGSRRLGRIMIRSAFRSQPEDHTTTYFYAHSMTGRWGPLETFRRMRAFTHMQHATPQICADWLALEAMNLCALRDFERAEQRLDEAAQRNPDSSWQCVCRTVLLEQQDRPEEALAMAQQAFDLRPWYRPAVQRLFDHLIQLNRDDEALELMLEANERLESGDLRVQLGAFYLESQRYQEAREIYHTIDHYHPLQHFDRKRVRWLEARRADAAYYCGDHISAIEHARRADTDFYTRLADNLESVEFTGQRVVLPVEFVRQNHMTCAPATLTAITGFWGRPVEHLDLAEEICFDGTPAHRGREWADRHDYVTREFRVTQQTAQTLIDRGIPFTLTTVHPGSAHLQAVIGYDSNRESLIIRDPGERHFNEFGTQEMLKRYAAADREAWPWCLVSVRNCSAISNSLKANCTTCPTNWNWRSRSTDVKMRKKPSQRCGPLTTTTA